LISVITSILSHLTVSCWVTVDSPGLQGVDGSEGLMLVECEEAEELYLPFVIICLELSLLLPVAQTLQVNLSMNNPTASHDNMLSIEVRIRFVT
jgi:hypothetical protein